MENNNLKSPKISVIMATYNGERFLSKAIESILSQTFRDFEFLIVNDCSLDATPQILRDCALRDSRVRVIENNANLGLTKSLNKAMLLARGQYIARMDDDDIALPQRLEKQYNFMASHQEFAIVGAWCDVIDERGEVIGEKCLAVDYDALKNKLLFNNQLVHSTWFAKKDILQKVGFYNEQFKKAQDYELLLRVATKYPVGNLPEKLALWRKRGDSLSFKDKQQQKYAIKARWLAITKYGYPKLRGLFHIMVRTVWLLTPRRFKSILKK